MVRRFLTLALFAPLFIAEQPASSILINLENKLAAIKSLEADFLHSYLPAHQIRGLEERGRLYLQKPDRMRWDYLIPERKSFLLQGNLLLSSFPEEKQLIRQQLRQEEARGTILGLLSGETKLLDLYLPEILTEVSNKQTVTLRLTPREEGEITLVLLEIDRRTWLIQRVIFLDGSGNRQEFRFSRFKLNAPLSAAIFELKIPPDWEVIDEVFPEKKGWRPSPAQAGQTPGQDFRINFEGDDLPHG